MDGNGERVDMMKVLVTGADGMLGRDVMRALREKHVNARGVDVADFDVTDGGSARMGDGGKAGCHHPLGGVY